MTTTTPDNTAGRPDRPPREPRSVKEALVNGFRDILARINPAKRQQAQDYIKKQPEKIDPNRPVTAEQQAGRNEQKTALVALKQVIVGQSETARAATTREIHTQTQQAISEMARNTALHGYDLIFYQSLINPQVPVPI